MVEVGLIRVIARERNQVKVFVLEWIERPVNGSAAAELWGWSLRGDFRFSANETLFRSLCSKVLAVAPSSEISTVWWKGLISAWGSLCLLARTLCTLEPLIRSLAGGSSVRPIIRVVFAFVTASVRSRALLLYPNFTFDKICDLFLNYFIILSVLNLPKLKFKKKNEAINNFLWSFLNLSLFFKWMFKYTSPRY